LFLVLDLEWKVVYVGSANSSQYDQTLDEILVGPIPVGVNKFILQADPPDASRIPENDILGVTVVLVSCSYRQREFLKVGYYVNNEYAEEFDEETGPPKPLDLTKIVRTILADKPRVTKFQIRWGDACDSNAEVDDTDADDGAMKEQGKEEFTTAETNGNGNMHLLNNEDEENIESEQDDDDEEQDDDEEHDEEEEIDLDDHGSKSAAE
jgi:Histone chaperone involved in gene silencing